MFLWKVIGDYMRCDYFEIELWHCVYEYIGSYVVMIFFPTNVDWVDIVYSLSFWILCLWSDMALIELLMCSSHLFYTITYSQNSPFVVCVCWLGPVVTKP